MTPDRFALALATSVLFTACDTTEDPEDPAIDSMESSESSGGDPVPDESESEGGTSNEDEDDEPGSLAASIAAAHAMPSRVATDGEALATMTATAVSAASLAQGGMSIVTTGTLKQQGASYTYAAEPTDRLVIDNTDLPDAELWVHTVQGDFTSVDDFLDHSHDLDFDVVIEDVVDARLRSLRNGGEIAGTAKGSFVHEGVRYDLDARIDGTETFENDSSGLYTKSETVTTGTISAAGYALTMNETWSFELISVDGESVQTGVRNVANVLDLDGARYEWLGVVTQTQFTNGKPDAIDDYWRADGEVRKDGGTWGGYRLLPTAIGNEGGFIAIVLETPDGTIELQSFAAY